MLAAAAGRALPPSSRERSIGKREFGGCGNHTSKTVVNHQRITPIKEGTMKVEDIKAIAVIGAGDMGHGIAEVALMAGYPVYLRDINQEFVDRGVARINESLTKLVSKEKVSAEHHEKIKSELLKPCVDLEEAVKEADLVIEAIPEIMELKKETFAAIDKATKPHTLMASNTSTMKITEIGSLTTRPEKVLGLHYFNPAVLMNLVEVIRGDKTSDETMQVAYDFVLKNGKVPVRVEKDVPGFIVNRVQAPSGVLLGCILDERIAQPEEVDALMRKLGMPMGPYELMDYTGLDIGYHGRQYYAKAIHPDFAPGRTIEAKIKAGQLGKKTGPRGGPRSTNPRPRIRWIPQTFLPCRSTRPPSSSRWASARPRTSIRPSSTARGIRSAP
jgi:enoyl-CoA hydratase/3-hydroxyacyl-CoA dehydrogenase